jgi:SH3 domain protein
MKKISWVCWLWLLPVSAYAETAYVTDRLTVNLRSTATEIGTTVKSLDAGAVLEVLERAGLYARVRDKQGAEGWIETRHLSAEPSARAQLAKLQDDLTRARAQLTEAQAQLKKADAALAQESARVKELVKNGANIPTLSVAPAITAAAAAPANGTESDSGSLLAWFGVSFAMLGLGFIGGALWLRESIRRRSGGMYLRV